MLQRLCPPHGHLQPIADWRGVYKSQLPFFKTVLTQVQLSLQSSLQDCTEARRRLQKPPHLCLATHSALSCLRSSLSFKFLLRTVSPLAQEAPSQVLLLGTEPRFTARLRTQGFLIPKTKDSLNFYIVLSFSKLKIILQIHTQMPNMK